MSLYSEYKTSLKSYEVEEIIDLIIFRPLSFLLVKLFYPTSITPNQISLISMIFGILGGVIYGFGTHEFLISAAIFLFVSNVLDCADGQLARLKKNGTKIGRIIDGAIDYVTGLAVFIGIGFALSNQFSNPLFGWVLAVTGGFARVIQNMYFDYYRNLYMDHVYGKGSNINEDIYEFTKEKIRLDKTNGNYLEKALINVYIKYSVFQKKTTKHIRLYVTPDEYRKRNRLILRLWSWLGSTTHLTVLVLFSFLNRVDLYLYLSLTFGLVSFLILFAIQKNIINKISHIPNNFKN